MAKRLFVGNLPFSIDDQGLAAIFSEVGTVDKATVIIDRATGRAKGFGFVEMSTDEEAEAAIQKLNGKEVEQRQIVVNEARPMEDRPRRDFGGNNRGGGRY